MIYPGFILIGVFVSLSIFYYYNQKARIRKEERRDALREKRQELLDELLEIGKNQKDAEN
ncbi:MAG: hypothetical protein QM687_09420 [Ferruginibacter sp.]